MSSLLALCSLMSQGLGNEDWMAQGDAVGAAFGSSVASAGDVNGDGFDDVIVGAPAYPNLGRAYVYLGSASGLSPTPDWYVELGQPGASFGECVASAGDVNGDGYGDVIIGATYFEDSVHTDGEGAAFVYLGSATGLSPVASWSAEGDQRDARLGFSVASAGDVDGDGYGDVVIGAHFYDGGQYDEGRAFVYMGSPLGLSTSPDWIGEGNQSDAFYGVSVAAAGDVDSDGYGDVLVGAPYWSNGRYQEGRAFLYRGSPSGLETDPAWSRESDVEMGWFGASVAGAGDIDGDGFDDVIVGASNYDVFPFAGAVFLHPGSASGLADDPAWHGTSDMYYGGAFGASVARLGDLDGDGFGEVIVGAYRYLLANAHVGRAFLFRGTATGPAITTAWTAEGSQDSEFFGYRVASAGDVNGDGRPDVIIGAPFHTDGHDREGAAFVYYGPDLNAIGTKYCSVLPNSTGDVPSLSTHGSPSVAAGDLTLLAGLIPGGSGLFFHGAHATETPFGNGFLCATADLVRGKLSYVDTWSTFHQASFTYDNSDAKHSLASHVGSTRCFQYWFRDTMAGGSLFNTTDAISILIQP